MFTQDMPSGRGARVDTYADSAKEASQDCIGYTDNTCAKEQSGVKRRAQRLLKGATCDGSDSNCAPHCTSESQ